MQGSSSKGRRTRGALRAAAAAQHSQAGEVQRGRQRVVHHQGNHGGGDVGGAHALTLCRRDGGGGSGCEHGSRVERLQSRQVLPPSPALPPSVPPPPLTDGQQRRLRREGGQRDVAPPRQRDGVHRKHVDQVEHGGEMAPHVVLAQPHLCRGQGVGWGQGGAGGLAPACRSGVAIACPAMGPLPPSPPATTPAISPSPTHHTLDVRPPTPFTQHPLHPPTHPPLMAPTAWCTTTRCDSSTPLGLPVVPLV